MRPMPLTLSVAALLCVPVVPVFAQGDPGAPPVANNSTQGEAIPQRLPQTSAKIAGVVVTGRNTYNPGQPVTIVFTIGNSSGDSAHYDYLSSQQFDVTAADAQGHTVWDWAQGRSFSPRITNLQLKPGQKKTYTAVWNGLDAQGKPVVPGIYTINAHMTSNDRPAITGSFAVNTDTDPENFGAPTRSPSDNGAIREVSVNPPIAASTTVAIGVPVSAPK